MTDQQRREEREAREREELRLKAEEARPAKSTAICKKYREGRCVKHMWATFGHEADTTCKFTHGNKEETKQVPCHNGAACFNYGCPYKHDAEREKLSKDENGQMAAECEKASEDENMTTA